jgi:hypothetical protein
MTIALGAALATVRGWTRLYTTRMEPALRDARRAEIESDLWELHEDARRRGASPTLIAIHMLLRLVLGIADDLAWRAEHIRVPPRILQEALWAGAVASLVFVWWLASTLQAVAPHAPADGINVVRLLYPVHPVASVPPLPAPPIEFARMASDYVMRPPPPPPPPK